MIIQAALQKTKHGTWIVAEVNGKLLKTMGASEQEAIARLMRMMQADGVGRYQLMIDEQTVERSVATTDPSSSVAH